MIAVILLLASLTMLALGEREAHLRSYAAARRLERQVARRPVRQRRDAGRPARVDRRVLGARIAAVLERRLHEAGVVLKVSDSLLVLAAGAALLGAAAGAAQGAGAAALAAAACPPLAWWGLGVARNRRIRRLDLQLPAALDLLVGQLRAHRSPAEAIVEVARRISGPLGRECGRVAEEVGIGVPLPHALEALRRRIPSRPLGTLVSALLVADRTGGNLAEFLSRQSKTVRDQVAFLQEVSAITAHARSTATILTLLPAGVALAMYLLDPRFFTPLLAPGPGRTLLAIAAVMEVLGWQVIRTMIHSVER